MTCSVDGCDRPKWARGWCGTHYQRWRAHGDPGPAELLLVKPQGRCSVDGCRKRVRVGIAGLCKGHYLRRYRYGDPKLGGSSPKFRAVCRIRSCDRRHYSRGLCGHHWAVITSRPTRRPSRVGFTTPEQLIARVDYYGGRCWMCGSPADHVDHVKPLAAAGCEWPANLRPACAECNHRKHSKWPFPTGRKVVA